MKDTYKNKKVHYTCCLLINRNLNRCAFCFETLKLRMTECSLLFYKKWHFAWVLDPLLSKIIFLQNVSLSNTYDVVNCYNIQ